ncbi:MAG: hypothetical protein V3V08_00690 [Nannocystaceae bacterium]
MFELDAYVASAGAGDGLECDGWAEHVLDLTSESLAVASVEGRRNVQGDVLAGDEHPFGDGLRFG